MRVLIQYHCRNSFVTWFTSNSKLALGTIIICPICSIWLYLGLFEESIYCHALGMIHKQQEVELASRISYHSHQYQYIENNENFDTSFRSSSIVQSSWLLVLDYHVEFNALIQSYLCSALHDLWMLFLFTLILVEEEFAHNNNANIIKTYWKVWNRKPFNYIDCLVGLTASSQCWLANRNYNNSASLSLAKKTSTFPYTTPTISYIALLIPLQQSEKLQSGWKASAR